jgi:NAD(P)-dependent dehydrogenase (short-subunit alcohol dehydrogenase family)
VHRFRDKAALVTGGRRGLGRAIAAQLAAEGAEVLITGRDERRLRQAAAELSADGASVWAIQADSGDETAIARVVADAVARMGRIDVLVNNAAVAEEHPLLDVPRESWDRVLATNLTGPFLYTQAVGRAMAQSGGGAIVNVASIEAHGSDAGFTSYEVAKAGLLALTRSTATQLARFGVRCNSVSPGWIDTPMVRASRTPEAFERIATAFDRVPAGRLLGVDEVAAACLFLASDDASGITGTDVAVDGGTLAHLYVRATIE